MRAASVLLAGALVLAGCATMPANAPSSPTGVRAIPGSPLNLGDWRRMAPAPAGQHFEREVASRYVVGQEVAAVSSDLRRYEFTCTANRDTAGRGDPPDQICRRTVTVEGCTHTWQVHLFGDGDALTRSRALYDRRCGGDGLLGGPS